MGASIIRSDTLGSRIVRGVQVGAIFLLFVTGAEAAEVCERVTSERPKIGLVLGGGGARGSAHIGIIRVLEEMKVPVDYVAGTSIGSLVAALYATGMNADELESVILGLDWDDLFVDDTRRADQPYRRKRDDNLSLFGPKVGIRSDASLIPRGAIAGQKISFVFESLVKGRIRTSDFDELPIPYRAVAADLATGTQVVLSEGDLALAMRASMSVPGVFEPVEWDDYLLVDGGIVNNVPVDVVRRMGADLVIAVDVGSGLVPRDRLNNLVAVVGQLSNLMIKSNSDLQIGSLTGDDLLIVPPLGDEVSSAAFDKSAEGIAIGYAAADAQRDQIARLSVSEADYRRHRAAIQTCVSAPPTIQFVRLDNHSRFDDSVIMERVAIETGTPLDLERLDASVREIYALGFLSLARYEVVEEDGATGIILHIDQDDRGTEFLEWGFDFYSDGDDSAFNLLAGYLNTAVDDKGSELRVTGRIGEDPALLVDLYKYLEPRLKVYVNPMLFAERREVPLFEDGDPVLIPEVTQYGGSISIGREFGRMASVDVGVRVFTGDVEIKVGPPDQDGIDFDGGEYFVKGIYDRLDDRYFPGDGSLVSAQYLKSASWLGADDDYEQVIVDALIARSFGRHTAMGGVRYYETLSDTAPVYGLFRAGGFLRLSGLQQGEIVGQNFAMGLAGYRYHFAGSGLLPAYVGMTLEYGQVAADAGDLFNDGLFAGSLYVGYRSPVGPLYVGMALAQEGRQAFFLRIGNVFGNSTIGR